MCACIVPWNSPLLLYRKLAPLLAAGNTGYQTFQYTSASTLEFMKIAEQCSLPAWSMLSLVSERAGSPLVDHRK